MAHIRLHNVHAEYELLSVRDYNLKRQLLEHVSRRSQPRPVIHALNGIDLDIPEGSRLGLVGANGAGKSTLLAVMSGLLPPTSGSVQLEGRVLALLGGASTGLDPEASGRDSIISMGVQLGESPAAMKGRIEDITEFSGLSKRIDHPVHTYSSGMQARLRFSVLTSLRPDILLVDEGIGMADVEFAERATERLAEFLSAAGILVLASHGEALVQQQCQTAVWIHQGAVMGSGRVDLVLRQYHAGVSAAVEVKFEAEADAKPEPVTNRAALPASARPSQAPARPADEKRAVAWAYWQMLGRAGDPAGLSQHTALLKQGMTVEELAAKFYNSTEATAKRAAWTGEVHLGLSHDIPYSLRLGRSAKHLVVTFPGAGTHRYVPAFSSDVVADLDVHQLAIGIGNVRPIKAPDLRTWVWDAGELIRQTAARLGVASRDVICVGHSFQAYFALLAGISARAGHLPIGAPPIRLGTCFDQLNGNTRLPDATHVMFEWAYRDSGIADDRSQVDVLDGLADEAIRRTNHSAFIALLVSPTDMFTEPCHQFADAIGSEGRLRCVVVDAAYEGHSDMGPAYREFAHGYVSTVVGGAAERPVEPEPLRPTPPVAPMIVFDESTEDGKPDYRRMVSRCYWQVLGRGPDLGGFQRGVEKLRAGQPIGELLYDVYNSAEAREQRAGWTGEYHLGMYHDIPYATKRAENAHHLVVTFPGVGTGRCIPTMDDLGFEVAAHRLEIGVSIARPLQHAGMATWALDVAALVNETAASLGIRPSNIICIGHSLKGVSALYIGLIIQAKYMLVGAPTLGGSVATERALKASRAVRAQGGNADLVEYLTTSADPIEEPGDHRFIDPMFSSIALNATHEAHLEVFISRKDMFWHSCEVLNTILRGHASLTCELVEDDYDGHNEMKTAYFSFLQQRLEAIAGRAEQIDLAADRSVEEVSRAYWQVLGRAPDPAGLKFHSQRLRQGASLSTLLQQLHECPEAQSKLAKWGGKTFDGTTHEIPYETRIVSGSRHLVVTSPGMGIGRHIPDVDDPAIGAAVVNRLAIGMAEERPYSPFALRSWVADAAALVHQTAAELDLDDADIICVGHSLRGAMAVLIGLEAGVGEIVVGAPPVQLGSAYARVAPEQPIEVRVVFDDVRDASGVRDNPGLITEFDDLIPAAAQAAEHFGSIDLFVSPSDDFWEPCRLLAQQLTDHPSLRCSLIEANYAGHNAMEPPYRAFAQAAVATFVSGMRRAADA